MADSEIEGALELLSHAQIDAEVCTAIAERETLVSATAFHAQQAVEKALLPQGVNVPKILKTTRDCFEWASAQINK